MKRRNIGRGKSSESNVNESIRLSIKRVCRDIGDRDLDLHGYSM